MSHNHDSPNHKFTAALVDMARQAGEARVDWPTIERRAKKIRTKQRAYIVLVTIAAAGLFLFGALEWPFVSSMVAAWTSPREPEPIAVKRVVEVAVAPDERERLEGVFDTPGRVPPDAVLQEMTVGVREQNAEPLAVVQLDQGRIEFARFVYLWQNADVEIVESQLVESEGKEVSVIEQTQATSVNRVLARGSDHQFIIQSTLSTDQLIQLAVCLIR